jgi:hypothetical protein
VPFERSAQACPLPTAMPIGAPPPQALPTHATPPAQALPQRPQCASELRMSVSQPLAALPSQSP